MSLWESCEKVGIKAEIIPGLYKVFPGTAISRHD